MNWFEGEIAQAISISKTKGAIFVVYICGKDEKSSQITELINQQEVAQILGGENFVAIKIEADSVSYQQFSQIYKQVPVPSIYFIGKQGVPIEKVTEVLDAKSFQDTLGLILQKGATQVQSFISSESKPEESTRAPVPENVVCENGVCTIKRDDQPSTSQASTSENGTAEEIEKLSVEEKVERAKQLLEKKREEKEAEEKENERQKEIERRKMGQNVQQLKRWQEDEKLKQVLEEREKEKRENQAARERVLAQIAQDKAERAAKFSPAAPSTKPSPPAPQVSPKPVNTNTARLQFRMPDGQTSTKDFASTETLENLHSYIRANLNLPFSRYTLATTFPRREFTSAENNQTLLELGLVPTAVILILPVNTLATNRDGFFSGLFWPLLAPIITLFMYLKTFLFGSGPADNPNGNDNQNKRSADSSSDPRVQPKVRRAGESTVIRRQGNIHRLANKKDSDDENNTWNGNSTQQM